MPAPKLDAEKITHPIQLMAAWFAMLILLVALLLTAASRITTPAWIPGFLVVSSILLSVIVMGAVFAMLTRFRPHLQDAKEYANWLKDERRFANQEVEKLQVRELPAKVAESVSVVQTTTNVQLSTEGSVSVMEVSNVRGAKEVVMALTSLGFPARIYVSEVFEEKERLTASDHTAIWIGSDVPPHIAILSIKTVIRIWPHLCYLHLSSDGGGPDYIHEQMFFGGSTRTAEEYGLFKWTSSQIEALPNQMSARSWHALVRANYGPDSLRQ